MDGAAALAKALAAQNVKHVFGIVGVPVIPISIACQAEGISYYGCRNEQAAVYAANAVGYLTRRPGVALVVSGPGVIHALAGLANAWSNCWPCLILGGANASYQDGMGAFQETNQVQAAAPFCKLSARVDTPSRTPFWVHKAVKTSMYGRPGAVYLDLPADVITGTVSNLDVDFGPLLVPPPPVSLADPSAVNKAANLLRHATNPLIVIGKGAAYARAEDELLRLVQVTGIPFLPTPMGKGVVDDAHPQCVSPARSLALKSADVVVLVGARLNWILHFGLPPRFRRDVKFIQVDICAEEMHTNVPTEVCLVGDAKAICAQLLDQLEPNPGPAARLDPWFNRLRAKINENVAGTTKVEAEESKPMNYYAALAAVRDSLAADAIICSEGSNTMDIGRTVLRNALPRRRLDAGTYGTMGVGLGFAMAAQLEHPDSVVVAVEGDSAFGFSGMEFETFARYNLPVIIVIINNNGIYSGVEELDPSYVPPTALSPAARYEDLAPALGGLGFTAWSVAELKQAMIQAIKARKPCIINAHVDPAGARRPQEFAWLTQDSKL